MFEIDKFEIFNALNNRQPNTNKTITELKSLRKGYAKDCVEKYNSHCNKSKHSGTVCKEMNWDVLNDKGRDEKKASEREKEEGR